MSGGFIKQYCSENIYVSQKRKINIAIVMVSFTDIPLVDYKKYCRKEKIDNKFELGYYGDYGIGLTKEWAITNRLNPVLYIQQKSLAAESLVHLVKELKSIEKENFEKKIKTAPLIYYSKNYEGKNPKNEASDSIYRFYNEREWRYVPLNPTEINNMHIVRPGFQNPFEKKTENLKLTDCVLSFSFNDISYIIVKEDAEIPLIIETIKRKFVEIKNQELELLYTKILTTKQLINDF